MLSGRHSKLSLLYLLLLVTCGAWLLWGLPSSCQNDQPVEEEGEVVHEILGMEESCMNCHADFTGFAAAHNPRVIGCTPCHLGQPYDQEEARAHEGMVLVPGNLSDVDQTCGAANCHGDIASRVKGSLMTSMAGVVNVNRFVFGESDTLSAPAHIQDLRTDRAADVHLRHLCASCHLGNEKEQPAPISESSRGGGCIACHLDYSGQGEKNPAGSKFHPAINLQVTNDHCFGCHSRSGRISTNYEGWHETKLDPEIYTGKEGYRHLSDGRIFRKMAPDVHHELGLECIDCHSAGEVMGDGKEYLHAEEAVKISCADCHFSGSADTVNYAALDLESKKILQLRNADYLDAAFVKGEAGEGLLNVILEEDNRPLMIGKNSGEKYLLSPPAEICTHGQAHDDLTCNACHTEWAPQCVGCHNAYEKEERAFDLLDRKRVAGKWVEYLGEFFAEQPTLGVVTEEDKRKIKAFIPGMIMTIDKSDFPGEENSSEIFHRLFAPVAPHTTNRLGRTCESCHSDPLALGYGRGALTYEIVENKGRWHFEAAYENETEDGLPQDAWIGFMSFPEGVSTTRPNARPFSVKEQLKILQVGACLTCHAGDSEVMLKGMDDFEGVLKKGEQCLCAASMGVIGWGPLTKKFHRPGGR